MKKQAFWIVIAMGLATTAFAADPSAPVPTQTPAVVNIGTIKSITPATEKGTDMKLIGVDAAGKEFTSNPQVAMDAAGKLVQLDQLKVGQKVKVIPLTGGGSAVQLEA